MPRRVAARIHRVIEQDCLLRLLLLLGRTGAALASASVVTGRTVRFTHMLDRPASKLATTLHPPNCTLDRFAGIADLSRGVAEVVHERH